VCSTAHLGGNSHRHCLSRLAEKSVRWRSYGQSVYQPEIHIKKCAVPLPSCKCHRYCAIVPVESRRRHRALQLFSCTWLRACANVPVPGPSCLSHQTNVHRRCLSRPADRSIRRRSGQQSMYLPGHTSQHVPCPGHCADAIGPVHRAHQIMPATSCP
jgi:hypothetical protein